jgi:ferric-dicitrate binding protein FerR (iron transport regulator)
MSSTSAKTTSKASTKAKNRAAARARRRRKKALAWVAAAALVAFVGYGLVAFRSGPATGEAASGDTAGGTTYGFVAETGSPVAIGD